MPDASGQIEAVALGSSSVKVGAGIVSAFIIAATAWAITMDRQNVRINVALENIQKQLDNTTTKLDSLNTIEKRVTRIEDNRFTTRDAEAMMDRCTQVEERVRVLELNTRKRR